MFLPRVPHPPGDPDPNELCAKLRDSNGKWPGDGKVLGGQGQDVIIDLQVKFVL